MVIYKLMFNKNEGVFWCLLQRCQYSGLEFVRMIERRGSRRRSEGWVEILVRYAGIVGSYWHYWHRSSCPRIHIRLLDGTDNLSRNVGIYLPTISTNTMPPKLKVL